MFHILVITVFVAVIIILIVIIIITTTIIIIIITIVTMLDNHNNNSSFCLYSFGRGDACLRQQTRPSLIQIMACHLTSDKPLPYSNSASFLLISDWRIIFCEKYNDNIDPRKLTWKCRLQNASHFLSASMYYYGGTIRRAPYINLVPKASRLRTKTDVTHTIDQIPI